MNVSIILRVRVRKPDESMMNQLGSRLLKKEGIIFVVVQLIPFRLVPSFTCRALDARKSKL